ncbi:FAD-dependent oxidoreductase [Dokdonella sp.]|uniref:FAD-dependent oxidoreductase n=1 Tax=Dokdonella sp. TaxID=2291710 RepID=UPI0035284555
MSRSWVRWTVVVVLALAAFALWRSGLLAELSLQGLKARQDSLAAWVAAHHWIALGSFFLAYVLVTGLSLPGAAIMTLAGGALFGLLEGTVLISFASSIGATLAFLVSRFVLRDSLRSKYGKRLKSFDEGIERDGAYYLFTLRLVPAVPFFLVNVLAGLTSLKTRVFYLVSQAGMLPGTIAYVYAGTQLAQIESLSDILSPGLIGAFVLLGILPLLMRWLTRWISARRVYANYRRPRTFDFNLIVIGAGSAGLVSSYIAAAVKAKVALIERHRMGGDCLNTGCVPSKALLRSARLLAEARNSQRYGIAKMAAEVEFADVMQRVHDVIGKVAPHDSVERYTELGVEVIRGDARIVSPWEVEVDGKRLTARSLIIATGAQAHVPELDGLERVDFRTSDTLWEIRELPKRLVVIGGGPIGCELSQAFARLGSEVVQVQKGRHLLPREDADASILVEQQFAEEGIRVETGCEAVRVEPVGNGGRLFCRQDGKEVVFDFDRLLLALGRKPNVKGFGLEELGVVIGKKGTVQADALMRTNYPNILVAGDVAGPYQFTHVASHQAWYASVNALLSPFWSFKADYRVIPWATFTDPEVARVGLSESEAREQDIEVEVTKYGLDDLDRAIADSSDHGFVKVLTPPGKDTILGATIVGDHAGDLLAEFVLAMKHGLGLNKLLGTIHIYPTMSEASKYAAGAWKRANAPQGLLRLALRFFAWRRG